MFKSQEAVDRIAGKQADVASHIETARLQASGIAGYRSEALELERRRSAIELAINSLKGSTTLLEGTAEYNREVMKRAASYLQAMNKGELGGGIRPQGGLIKDPKTGMFRYQLPGS